MIVIDGREYVSPTEAALILGVSVGHVRWLLRQGRLVGWQDRRRRWVLLASARRYQVPASERVESAAARPSRWEVGRE